MCGITGFVKFENSPAADLARDVARMNLALRHRGPDDSGEWVDEATGAALGLRRLSIIDVSSAGHQPMASESGRYVIVHNGEIYNFEALRSELSPHGHKFRGHSDTEVMLAAIEQWGLEAAVARFVGMFAFAVWDRQKQTLSLVRDRVGIKPLYYGWAGRTFLFGSELKALRAFPGCDPAVDRNALTLFLRYSYIPQPYTIYEGVQKLPPGTILRMAANRKPEITSYWSVRDVYEAGAAKPFAGSESDAIEQLHALLSDAVKLRMISDVPLGAFLSGGIDSSTVVALMQAQSNRPVKTFSIGFREDEFNEAQHARRVASHLGTEHTELYVASGEAMAVLPLLPALYDEPFADSSQIPTYLVSQLARRHVTVSLSGDGGDELFGGYPRYAQAYRMWRASRVGGSVVRRSAARTLALLNDDAIDTLGGAAMRLLPRDRRVSSPSRSARRYQQTALADVPSDYYRALVSRTAEPASMLRDGHEPPCAMTDAAQWPRLSDPLQWMLAVDLLTYLPDQILAKLDRASMGVSLEARVPMLDHRVVEFAASLPSEFKLRGETSKWILRQVLHRHVPANLIERPKMGFNVPVARWIRGPLRDWAEGLLSESRLRDDGFFDVAAVRRAWQEHLHSESDNDAPIWEVLMFQSWWAHWKKSVTPSAAVDAQSSARQQV